MKLALVVVALLLASNAIGAESYELRLEAARRYLAVAPMADLMDSSAQEIAQGLPPEERDRFVRLFTEAYDVDALEASALHAAAETFSVEELNAFTEFYGSAVGQSALAKFGAYMALVMPEIQQQTRAALQKMQSEQAAQD